MQMWSYWHPGTKPVLPFFHIATPVGKSAVNLLFPCQDIGWNLLIIGDTNNWLCASLIIVQSHGFVLTSCCFSQPSDSDCNFCAVSAGISGFRPSPAGWANVLLCIIPGKGFHLPSCRSSRVQTRWLRSVQLYTTIQKHSLPISFLKSSRGPHLSLHIRPCHSTPTIINYFCCLLHNTSQAENNPDKMTEMSSCGRGLYWQDLPSPKGSYMSPAGTAQGRWKSVLASLPSQLKEIFWFSVFVLLFCTFL